MIKVMTFRRSVYEEEDFDKEINEFLKQKITVRNISCCTADCGSAIYLITQIAYEDGVREGSRWVYSEPDSFAVTREA